MQVGLLVSMKPQTSTYIDNKKEELQSASMSITMHNQQRGFNEILHLQKIIFGSLQMYRHFCLSFYPCTELPLKLLLE